LRPYPNWLAHSQSFETYTDAKTGKFDTHIKDHFILHNLFVGQKKLINEAAIISPFRVRADHCNRLWVMDTGLTVSRVFTVGEGCFFIPSIFQEALGSATQIVPSSILIFDLKTDKLIRRIYFDDKVAKPDSLFANIVSLWVKNQRN
jgi:hypothetical protein